MNIQRPTPDEKHLVLKKQALKYYQDNGIPKILEDLLNTMYYEKPNDIYGYMSLFFSAYAQAPIFDKVKGGAKLDGRGFPCLRVLVHYLCQEKKQILSEVSVCLPCHIPRQPVTLDKGDDSETEAVMFINDNVQEALVNLGSTQDLMAIDAILENVDRHLPKPTVGCASYMDVPSITIESTSTTEQGKRSSGMVSSLGTASTRKPSKQLLKKEEEVSSTKPFATKSEQQFQLDATSATSTVYNESAAYIPKATFCTSAALCKAVAKLNHLPIHTHINTSYNIMRQCPNRKLSLPNFLVTMVGNSRLRSPTRINLFVEAGIITSMAMTPLTVDKLLGILFRLNQSAAEHITRFAVMNSFQVGDQGSPILPVEHLEQPMEFLNTVTSTGDLKLGTDFSFYFVFSPNDCYDEEKAKYEFGRGLQKHSDEMIDVYADLVKRFPSISYLVDPFIPDDVQSWVKLASRLEEFSTCQLCSIMTGLPKVKGEAEEKKLTELPVNAVIIYPDTMGTVSEVFSTVEFIRRLKPSIKIVISVPEYDTDEDFIVDLCIGVQAQYLKMGGLMRGERVAKLNRFVDICEGMSDSIYEWCLT